MKSITITLQIPDRRLSPNGSQGISRMGMIMRSQLVKAYRREAFLRVFDAAAAHGIGGRSHSKTCRRKGRQVTIVSMLLDHTPWPRAMVSVTWYGASHQCLRRDQDNVIATLKPAFDGIADAGVVTNDRLFHQAPPALKVDKQRPRVEIRLDWMAATEQSAESKGLPGGVLGAT